MPRTLVGTCPMTPADLERIEVGTGVSAVLSLQHDAYLANWGIDYGQMRTRGEKMGYVWRVRALQLTRLALVPSPQQGDGRGRGLAVAAACFWGPISLTR